MKTINLTLIFVLLIANVFAQDKKEQDQKAIKGMCGCYEVTFNFGETFSPNKDYKFHDNYRAGGLEWVELVEDSQDKIVMQHLLIVADTMIIKHWRQDWLYENTELYDFEKSKTWNYVNLPKSKVKGQWTQKVFQVDDSPRYEGTATWVHVDGRHYWENTTNAPLPRREFSKRKDYNVMKRRNRHELTAYGWVHEQDNDKIMLSEASSQLLAQEKGWNTYEKVEDSRCKAAQDWWTKNKAYWADVRASWDVLFAKDQGFGLKAKVEDKRLFDYLFALGDKWSEAKAYDSTKARKEIDAIIAKFVK